MHSNRCQHLQIKIYVIDLNSSRKLNIFYCRNRSYLSCIHTPLYYPVTSLSYPSMVGASLLNLFSWPVEITLYQYGPTLLWGANAL